METEKKRLCRTALFAGAMIGVGCMVFLACENRIAGAFLFSAGLFFVLTFGGTLFTGVCGLKTPWKRLAAVFLLNGAGIFLAAVLTWTGGPLPDAAASVMRKKLAAPALSWLSNGVLCGAMMYLGVTGFWRAQEGAVKAACVVYAVSVFILAMFEHSIADMGYLFIALPCLNAREVLLSAGMTGVVTIGNIVGGKAVRLMTEGR